MWGVGTLMVSEGNPEDITEEEDQDIMMRGDQGMIQGMTTTDPFLPQGMIEVTIMHHDVTTNKRPSLQETITQEMEGILCIPRGIRTGVNIPDIQVGTMWEEGMKRHQPVTTKIDDRDMRKGGDRQ